MKHKDDFTSSIGLSNSNLQKIIKFYLLECPVAGKSFRGKKFSDFGIERQPAFARLKKLMLATASESLKTRYFPCKKIELEEKMQLMNDNYYPNEFCIFLEHEEKTIMQSLFSAIRNAIAHGSFRYDSFKGERVYYFLNHDGCDKARIVLKENTLLKWIECVKNFNKNR
ncbi:MAG: hypothetical protein IKL77_05435 [Clostridia bacterium]|nr:hypothetical protein [Clostridia bacterium]